MYVPHVSLPVTDYNNPVRWIGAYPWLFPYGQGGPEIQRKVPYAQHLLVCADKKFRLDVSFKFHIFNVLQKRDVSLHSSFLVRRSGFHASSAEQIGKLNHDSLVKVIASLEKNVPVTDPNLQALLKSLSTTGAKILGIPIL